MASLFIYTELISSCNKTFIQSVHKMSIFSYKKQNPEVVLPTIFIFIFPVDCLGFLPPSLPPNVHAFHSRKNSSLKTFIPLTAMLAMNHLLTNTSRQVNFSLTQSFGKRIEKLTISFHPTNIF